eukprot:TRINITY_DN11381_c0_g1_i3.p1 TRINITY_DN11381_c0_g1~~TRINITY_DN11381_c0_g1_i3.p1  ORF type:complete len:693 (+),score=100.75 TRINITY_DN11381_c0_g1_i3:38-2080(+)
MASSERNFFQTEEARSCLSSPYQGKSEKQELSLFWHTLRKVTEEESGEQKSGDAVGNGKGAGLACQNSRRCTNPRDEESTNAACEMFRNLAREKQARTASAHSDEVDIPEQLNEIKVVILRQCHELRRGMKQALEEAWEKHLPQADIILLRETIANLQAEVSQLKPNVEEAAKRLHQSKLERALESAKEETSKETYRRTTPTKAKKKTAVARVLEPGCAQKKDVNSSQRSVVYDQSMFELFAVKAEREPALGAKMKSVSKVDLWLDEQLEVETNDEKRGERVNYHLVESVSMICVVASIFLQCLALGQPEFSLYDALVVVLIVIDVGFRIFWFGLQAFRRGERWWTMFDAILGISIVVTVVSKAWRTFFYLRWLRLCRSVSVMPFFWFHAETLWFICTLLLRGIPMLLWGLGIILLRTLMLAMYVMELRRSLLSHGTEKDRAAFADETSSNFGDFQRTFGTCSAIDWMDIDVFNPFFKKDPGLKFLVSYLMTLTRMIVFSAIMPIMVILAKQVSDELRQKKITENCWSTSRHAHKLRQSLGLETDGGDLLPIHDFDVLGDKQDFLNLLHSLRMTKMTARRIFTLVEDCRGVSINLYLLTLLRISNSGISDSGSEHLNLTSILYGHKHNARRLEIMMEFLVQEFGKLETLKQLPHELVDHDSESHRESASEDPAPASPHVY